MKPSGVSACAKIITLESDYNLQSVINEINILSNASELKMALKYYKFAIENQNNRKHICIITEYCSKGTLNEYIRTMKKNNIEMSFEEMKDHLFQFINFFASLQHKDICHRDIKPDNFFVNSNDEIKVGDFGSSKKIIDEIKNNTIQGSPQYLSPELREARQDPNTIKTDCNYFKSDVFSLGLVLLYLFTQNQVSADTIDVLRNKISLSLPMIKYCAIRDVLSSMLSFKPSNRPDFISLKKDISSLFYQGLCFGCYRELSDKITCEVCQMSYHSTCCNSQSCKNCGNNMINTCSTCKEPKTIKCFKDKLCEICARSNLRCYSCIGFEVVSPDKSISPVFGSNFSCTTCEEIVYPDSSSKDIICANCKSLWCQICKRASHNGPCSQTAGQVKLICPVCFMRLSFNITGLFYYCEGCSEERCLVCMKKSGKTHIRCAKAFSLG